MEEISRDTIELAAGGDLNAFEQIYLQTSAFVFSVACRILEERQEAEEVTQDVFLKIYKNIEKFKFESSFKTWIYRIVVNTSITSLRKKIKVRSHYNDYAIEKKIQWEESQKDRGQLKEDNEYIVSKMLSFLSDDQRVCIILKNIEGLSCMEIAQVLNVNTNTVKTRLKRARDLMLKKFPNKKEVFHEM